MAADITPRTPACFGESATPRLGVNWTLIACALFTLFYTTVARAETPDSSHPTDAKRPRRLVDPTEGPDAVKDFAPHSVAEVLDAPNNSVAVAPDGLPRAGIAIDGEVYLGSWRKLEGRTTVPGAAGDSAAILGVEWVQKSGPKIGTPSAFFKNAELWVFLIKPGNYAFTYRARNVKGWSAQAEIRFAVMPGRATISEADGFRLAGSCERIVLPGTGWRQVAGPLATFRPAENGRAVLANDAGLYIFEIARLEEGLPERRGILVPPGKDGKLGDRRPIANLPKTLAGVANRPLVLDGSLSMDPDTEDEPALKARWSTPDLRRGVNIEAQPGLRAFFKAERPGSYSANLVVSDGRLDSPPVTVFIEIAAAAADDFGEEPGTGDGTDSGASGRDLLMRRVSLAIWPPEKDSTGTLFIPDDSGLERAVQLFPKRCSVGLLVEKGVARPGHYKDLPLALEANKTPLRHLLDGIARQTGTRYRRDGDRAFWLVNPAEAFRDEKMDTAAAGVDALHEKPDASDLMAPILEFLKQPLATADGASITFETQANAFVAMLPTTACVRLREIVQVLREPAGIGLPYPEPPTKAEERLREQLGVTMITLHGRYRLDRLMRELAQKSGLAIGFDPKQFPAEQFPNGLPYLKVAFENAPLRQVFRDLVEDAGFDGCSVEAPAGIWFYKGPRPFPTGELLWNSADVRAYDLSSLFVSFTAEAALMLSGEAIAHAVRSRVYPASWKDAGTLVFYHPGTRKLVVVHAPEAHRKVVELLNDMRERGIASLGASE